MTKSRINKWACLLDYCMEERDEEARLDFTYNSDLAGAVLGGEFHVTYLYIYVLLIVVYGRGGGAAMMI